LKDTEALSTAYSATGSFPADRAIAIFRVGRVTGFVASGLPQKECSTLTLNSTTKLKNDL